MPLFNPTLSSLLTTKGDVIGFSTVNDRIPVGADGLVFVARSSATDGVIWGTASAATEPFLYLNGAR